ncbi:MAG: archaeosortase/exosortase family protein [Ardenticatenia bacterium]|nr:archaeosortase/exosortase family protein [Ardenticatenia bacterium]
MLVARDVLGLEPFLAHSAAQAVHMAANAVGVPTRIFANAPGILLVLVVVQPVGWTVLQIGVESSGLLEMGVLVSLLSFYPGWSLRRRLASILVGLAATWTANVVRLLIIVIALHMYGKQALTLSHTFIGKIVFFVLTVGIYWHLITRATVDRPLAPAKAGSSSG